MQVLPSGREVVQEVSQQQSFKAWHYWPRVLGQVEALVEDAESGTFSQLQLTEKAVMVALSVTAMLIRKGPILALSPYPVGTTGNITHAYGAATHDLLMDVLEVPKHLSTGIADLLHKLAPSMQHTAVKLLSCLCNLLNQLQQSWELQHIPADAAQQQKEQQKEPAQQQQQLQLQQQQLQLQQQPSLPNVDSHKVTVAKQLIASGLLPRLKAAVLFAQQSLPLLPHSGRCPHSSSSSGGSAAGDCVLCWQEQQAPPGLGTVPAAAAAVTEGGGDAAAAPSSSVACPGDKHRRSSSSSSSSSSTTETAALESVSIEDKLAAIAAILARLTDDSCQAVSAPEAAAVALSTTAAAEGVEDSCSAEATAAETAAAAAAAEPPPPAAAAAAGGSGRKYQRRRAKDIWSGKAAVNTNVQTMHAELLAVCDHLFQYWPGGALSSAAIGTCVLPAAQLALSALRYISSYVQHPPAGVDAYNPPADGVLELGVCALQVLANLTRQLAGKAGKQWGSKSLPQHMQELLQLQNVTPVLVTVAAAAVYADYMAGRVYVEPDDDSSSDEEEEAGFSAAAPAAAAAAAPEDSAAAAAAAAAAISQKQSSSKHSAAKPKGSNSNSSSSSQGNKAQSSSTVGGSNGALAEEQPMAPMQYFDPKHAAAAGDASTASLELDAPTRLASLCQVHLVSDKDHPMSGEVWELLCRLEQQTGGQLLPPLQAQLLEALGISCPKAFLWLAAVWGHHYRSKLDSQALLVAASKVHSCVPSSSSSSSSSSTAPHGPEQQQQQGLQQQQQASVLLLAPLLLRWQLWKLEGAVRQAEGSGEDVDPELLMAGNWAQQCLQLSMRQDIACLLSSQKQQQRRQAGVLGALRPSVLLELLQAHVQQAQVCLQLLHRPQDLTAVAAESQADSSGSTSSGDIPLWSWQLATFSGVGRHLNSILVHHVPAVLQALTSAAIAGARAGSAATTAAAAAAAADKGDLFLQASPSLLRLAAVHEALLRRYAGTGDERRLCGVFGASRELLMPVVLGRGAQYGPLKARLPFSAYPQAGTLGWQYGLLTAAAARGPPGSPAQSQLLSLLFSFVKYTSALMVNSDFDPMEVLQVQTCCNMLCCVSFVARAVLAAWQLDPDAAAAGSGSGSNAQQSTTVATTAATPSSPSQQQQQQQQQAGGCRAGMTAALPWVVLLGQVCANWARYLRHAFRRISMATVPSTEVLQRASRDSQCLLFIGVMLADGVQPALAVLRALMQGVQLEQYAFEQQEGLQCQPSHAQQSPQFEAMPLGYFDMPLGLDNSSTSVSSTSGSSSSSKDIQQHLQGVGLQIATHCRHAGIGLDGVQHSVADASAIAADAARVIADCLPMLEIGASKDSASLPAHSEAALAEFFDSHQEEVSHAVFGRAPTVADVVRQVWLFDPSILPLIHKLTALDSALSRFPNPHSCNMPLCINLGSDSERDLMGGKRSVCGRCRTAHYCGKRCQQEHWKIHRAQCDRIAGAPAAAADAAVARTREA